MIVLLCTLERLPGVVLRYLPFRMIATSRQKRLLFHAYIAAFALNTLLCGWVWNTGHFDNQFYRSSFAIFGLITMAVNVVIIRGRFWVHLFTAGLNMCLVLMSITIAGYAANLIVSFSGFDRFMLNAGLTCIVCGIGFPLFSDLLVSTVSPFLITERNYYWKMICLVPWLIYISCTCLLPVDNTLLNLGHVQIMVMLNCAAVVVCYCIAEDYKHLQQHDQTVQLLKRQQEYYEQLTVRVEEARKLRHDLKNHLMAIRGFAERDDKAGLIRYCDEMQIMNRTNMSIPHTGNAAVDGVVYHYMQIAQENRIDFRMMGVFGQNEIADIDLCVLLGNALDNAVAACVGLQEGRFIELNVRMDGDVLAIMVINSFDGVILEEDGNILSRKRKNETGVGIRSMKDICKKYQGSFEVRYEDKTFSCLMLLNGQETTGN